MKSGNESNPWQHQALRPTDFLWLRLRQLTRRGLADPMHDEPHVALSLVAFRESNSKLLMDFKIAEFQIRSQRDVTRAVRRARLLAMLAGMPTWRRTAFGRAVGEIADNVIRHAGCGTITFSVTENQGQQGIESVIRNDGPGVDDLERLLSSQAGDADRGILRARDLVDRFAVRETGASGTAVSLCQDLPAGATAIPQSAVAAWEMALMGDSIGTALLASVRRSVELDAELTAMRDGRPAWEQELQDLRALNSSLELLALVASKTNAAVVILDEQEHVEWLNEAFERMTGYALAECLGHSLDELLLGRQNDRTIAETIRRAVRDGRGLLPEFAFHGKDGRLYWAAGSATPIADEQGRVIRCILVVHDVTQRREARDALEKSREAAEAASRAKSEFLANISHEIRTPMNAIIGMTELALCTELTEEQREFLTTAKGAAESLLDLLNDILDLSKIESGRLELDSVEFDLAKLVGDTLRTLAARAAEKGFELACRFSSAVPQSVVGDPARLRQVLTNLAGNAIKFTEKGEVVVSVDPEWQTATEVSLQFSVSDTGIGIPSDRLDRIFEAFRQGDSSITRRYGGTGLGLAISSRLVQLMDGKIWVRSQEGQGSTFHFTARFGLPAAASEDLTATELELAGKSALVVDDNATNRRILQDTLKTWGIHPTLAESASAAIEALENREAEEHSFDFVVLDALMPEMDGFALLERLRLQRGLRLPTVLMLSSANRTGDLARCRQLGVTVHLTKPVAPADLRQAIIAALGQTPRPVVDPVRLEPVDLPETTLKVLVADDNDANRVLASRVLAERGHQITAARGGQEVLDELDRQAFDVVVLDVQMPVMDGFATTTAIREKERTTRLHLPIVAMTAYAMKGDRERCLEAGMDAYLAKPIRARELWSLVEGLARPMQGGRELAPGDAVGSRQFEFSSALARLEGDAQLLKEQMKFVVNDAPSLVDKVSTAISGQAPDALRLAAHRLKGLVSTVDASEASECAASLEHMGQTGNLEEAGPVCQKLEQHVSTLIETLKHFLATH